MSCWRKCKDSSFGEFEYITVSFGIVGGKICIHKVRHKNRQRNISLSIFVAGRIDPVEYVGVSQQRNGNVRNRNHPLCGCATLVIQKTPFHYNRGVQATI